MPLLGFPQAEPAVYLQTLHFGLGGSGGFSIHYLKYIYIYVYRYTEKEMYDIIV